MEMLSIFVDESGDFGRLDNTSPYYFVTLVFHRQSDCIGEQLAHLERELAGEGDCRYIHTGPIIRRESPYSNMSIDERRRLLYKMRTFLLHLPVSCTTVRINRKEAKDRFALTAQLTKKLREFICCHFDYFSEFDKVIVYYDNGQQELNLILNSIMNSLLSNVEFRKASPTEYRLLQTADYICSMELLAVKLEEKRLSNSEKAFFYKPQELKKSFIKSVRTKELK